MRDLIDSFIVFFFLLNHCFSSASRFPRISCVVTVERSLNITGCHALLQNALCVLGVLIDLSSLNTFHRLYTCSLIDQLFILQLMVLMVCIAKKMLWVGGSRMMHNKGRHHLNLSKLRQGHDVFVFFDACALIWWFFSWLDLKRASFLTYSLFSQHWKALIQRVLCREKTQAVSLLFKKAACLGSALRNSCLIQCHFFGYVSGSLWLI